MSVMRRGGPPLSRIYAALDADAHRVLQRAMRLCRGAVLTVRDLQQSLGELSITSGLLGRNAPRVPDFRHRPEDAPFPNTGVMGMDCALHQALQRAYEGAVAIDRLAPRISPVHLWEAVHRERFIPTPPTGTDSSTVIIEAERPDVVDSTSGPTAGSKTDRGTCCDWRNRHGLERIVAKWLALQACPSARERQSQLTHLAREIRAWETRTGTGDFQYGMAPGG